MFVSHRHKFIFVRTEKTAGSSISACFKQIYAPGDLVHDMSRPGWARFSPIHHGALKRHFPKFFGLHTHATIAQVRQIVGDDVFRSYFKFCIERNPWDRQVSLYFQRKAKLGRAQDADFDRDMRSLWFRSTEYTRLHNFEIYSIGGRIAVDHVIRYENLSSELPEVLARLGVEEPLDMPRLRSGYRNDNQDYRQHYSDFTRELVRNWYRREIDALGYQF